MRSRRSIPPAPSFATLHPLALALAVGWAGAAGAQTLGGNYALPWLVASPSAQATGLGGWQLRLDGRDPALAAFNPAALNAHTDRVVHVSQDRLAGQIGQTALHASLFAQPLDAHLGLSVRYASFGEFTARDPFGNEQGTFSGGDFAVGLAAAKTLGDRLHVGLAAHVLGGALEQYNQLGASVSAGVLYTPDSARQTAVGLQLQHAGVMFDALSEQRDPLPAELSLGISRRLTYLPVRVGAIYRDIGRWDILYDDPARRGRGGFIGEETAERGAASRFVDNLGRHLGANAELYLGRRETVQLRIGYDHRRQREAKVAEFRSLGGFSFGAGLNLRRLRIDYGHSVYAIGGGTHHLGLLVDFAGRGGERAEG